MINMGRIILVCLCISYLSGCLESRFNGFKQSSGSSLCKKDGKSAVSKKVSVSSEEKELAEAAAPTTSTRDGHYGYARVSLFGELPETTNVRELAIGQYYPTSSLQQHTFATEGACFDPEVSPDGKHLAFASTKNSVKPDIYIKPVFGTVMTQLTSNPASDVQPAFSPDGKRLAFASDRTGSWDIFVIDTTGRNLQQVTDDPAPELHPSFSPDGKKIAYSKYNSRTGRWEIWLLHLGNPGQKKFVATGLFPRFSPIENKIVYQRAKSRGSRWFSIWVITLGEGDQPSMPTEIVSASDRALISPAWSADGTKIVYCAVYADSVESAKKDAQIWMVYVDGHAKMPITDTGVGCFSPIWSRDGRIFFCSNRGGVENIWSILPFSATGEKLGTVTNPKAPTHLGEQATSQVDEDTLEIQANQPINIDH